MSERVEELFARRARSMRRSDIRDAFKLTERTDLISLAGGFPAAETFPLAELEGVIQRLLEREGGSVFQYGPTEGLGELRARVAEELTKFGLAFDPEQILLTSGSQQALDLIGRVFLDPGDVVLVEAPGYVGGLSAFAAYEARLVGVEMDREGLVPSDLERQLHRLSREGARVKLLYTVPTFQNPTGTCLPVERRAALVELAERYGFLIVEDDPYREIWFDSPPPAPLAAGDPTGHVLYLGSFSKVFLPGLRVGWVAGAPPLLARLALAKQPADLCSNIFGQKLVEAYLREGRLEPRKAALRREYRERCAALDGALREVEAPLAWETPSGGFFLWVTLPEGGDARRLTEVALREGVAYVAGDAFCVDGGGRRCLRLAFSQSSPERLKEAAIRLGRAIRKHLAAESRIFSPAGQKGGYDPGPLVGEAGLASS
ncbi:MAG TPA: PLP-dependent aminotransferase family protein [Firmicutes bacterium]|nr:PLP-dependent aminotransferase family protein [Bacillota bacterium]